MPIQLTAEELTQVSFADELSFRSPIPTRSISSEEFMPSAQTPKQKEFEVRLKALGSELAKKQGVSRRRFFQTSSGMAAAFVAMNDTYGPMFGVSRAEAATPEMAKERAAALSGQFIMDMHTHFLHDKTRLANFARGREAVGKAGWNPALVGKEQTLEDLKFANYFKEVFLDSDTKVALVSGSASFEPIDWFLTNEQKRDARANINSIAGGSKRAMAHLIFTPGVTGALEKFERELIELKPDSIKGYTIGDNTNKPMAKWPWRMDDEKLAYPYYERAAKAGIKNVCVHKGLFPPSTEKQYPQLLDFCNVSDVGKAAKDWPQLNFIIYHSAYRFGGGGKVEDAWSQVEQSGRVEWVNDLADIPAKYGVSNVYGDLGQIFAQSTVANPKLTAFMMGTLIKGLGMERVVWGTDAIWTGSPQWQIEAMRRLEIPEDMQKKYGFAPLGAADGPVKTTIFGENNARLYNYTHAKRAEIKVDLLAQAKTRYEEQGTNRSNIAYGYMRKVS
jgi:uncharacterized protein